MAKLTKHNGTATDRSGCQFHYRCYVVKDDYGRVEERHYACIEFPEIVTKTLDEMKTILSNKGR